MSVVGADVWVGYVSFGWLIAFAVFSVVFGIGLSDSDGLVLLILSDSDLILLSYNLGAERRLKQPHHLFSTTVFRTYAVV